MEQYSNMIFPIGEDAPELYFTGNVKINILAANDTIFDCVISNVTFEKGGRTNWHKHPGGQIILITDGEGSYQLKNGPVMLMKKGDVVKFDPGIEHWHGATANSSMTHIAINPNSEKGLVEWLAKVTDPEYNG